MASATDFPSPLQWSIDHHPSAHAIQAVRNELIAYNIATAAMDTSQAIAVWLHDAHGGNIHAIVDETLKSALELFLRELRLPGSGNEGIECRKGTRLHRAINVGQQPYEEITVFFLDQPGAVPQPKA